MSDFKKVYMIAYHALSGEEYRIVCQSQSQAEDVIREMKEGMKSSRQFATFTIKEVFLKESQ